MKQLRAVAKLGLVVIVVAFVAWTGWDLAQRWHRSEPVALRPGWLAAALLPIAYVSLAQGIGWLSLLQHMLGRRLPFVSTMELLLASMLGRYAPAKVGMPAILVARARDLEISAPAMASSLVLMVAVYGLLGVGIGVASVMATLAPLPESLADLRSTATLIVLGGMLAVVALLLVVDRRHYPHALLKRLSLEGAGPIVNLSFVAWFSSVWLGWWLHGMLVVRAVGGTWSEAVTSAGIFVLAPVIGFLALVAPGGLGVREAVIARGIAPIVGSAAAVSSSLIARLASLGMDVAVWLAFRAVSRRARGSR